MAEAKRRSEVKKFLHKTDYPQYPLPSQRRLLDAILDNTEYDWVCTLSGDTVPPYGTTLIVRIGHTKELEVLWGNQVIARVTDALGSELATALCNSRQAGVAVATSVVGKDADHPFAIRFLQEIHQSPRQPRKESST